MDRSRRESRWNLVGVVSGLLNPNEFAALERWTGDQLRHGEGYQEGGCCRRRHYAFRQLVDPIEDGVRERVRGSSRRDAGGRVGRRPGASVSDGARRLPTEPPILARRLPAWPSRAYADRNIRKDRKSVHRARRIVGEDGRTREWKSQILAGLRAPHEDRRRLDRPALLCRTDTRRVRRALKAVFAGGVGKDVVGRTWRKVKGDWEASNARSLTDEPIIGSFSTARSCVCDSTRGHVDLAPCRARRAGGRPKDAACDRGHRRRERSRLASAARRPRQARLNARTPRTKGVHSQMAIEMPRRRCQPRGGSQTSFHLHALSAKPIEVHSNIKCDRTPA